MNYGVVHADRTIKRSWGEAYKRFLMSREENLILKIAPIILLIGAPEVLIGNLVPVVGEVIDVGSLWLTVIVALRTISAVRKYRYLP